MKKEFNKNNLPEDKREEILKQIAASQEDKKLKKAQQKEAGKLESQKRKELIRFAKENNVKFFEAFSLCRGGYTVQCGYIPPMRIENKKKSPVVMIPYAISCCSPTDKFNDEKGKMIIIKRLRSGKSASLKYRASRIPESVEDTRLPMLIDLDLVHTAATGIYKPGAQLPQWLIESDKNE